MATPEQRPDPGDQSSAGGPAGPGPGAPGGDRRDLRSLRERIAASGWRRRVAATRSVHHTYRLVVGIVGALIVVVGIVTIPLPGPGWLTVIFGLIVLATEFTWAERLLHFTRRNVMRWTEWVGRQRVWVRVVIAVATAAFVYGVVVVTLHLAGVPSWIPAWVPLWR